MNFEIWGLAVCECRPTDGPAPQPSIVEPGLSGGAGIARPFHEIPEPLFARCDHPEQSAKGAGAIKRDRVTFFDSVDAGKAVPLRTHGCHFGQPSRPVGSQLLPFSAHSLVSAVGSHPCPWQGHAHCRTKTAFAIKADACRSAASHLSSIAESTRLCNHCRRA